jgi:hypothetical protein
MYVPKLIGLIKAPLSFIVEWMALYDRCVGRVCVQ